MTFWGWSTIKALSKLLQMWAILSEKYLAERSQWAVVHSRIISGVIFKSLLLSGTDPLEKYTCFFYNYHRSISMIIYSRLCFLIFTLSVPLHLHSKCLPGCIFVLNVSVNFGIIASTILIWPRHAQEHQQCQPEALQCLSVIHPHLSGSVCE